MVAQGTRRVEHDITVRASAQDVFRLLADVEQWPRLFPPTVFVEVLERADDEERIRIWATARDEAKTWTSRRRLDRAGSRIEFRQEVSAHPVASMGGTWIVEPTAVDECRVLLLHEYAAVDDDPAGLRWIDDAVDRNSRSELAALKANAEVALTAEDLVMSFEDTVSIDGAAKDVYDFLNEAQLWQERLPHVARVRLTEDSPGLQRLEMDTSAKDGSTHTTVSIRVCFPHDRIVYKQITVPALMTLHTGRWTIEETESATLATSRHTVVVNRDKVAPILGEGATVADARAYIRDALGNNSRATLGLAKAYAERRR